ncbi:MAG: gamma-glutamylcyclotransferase [Prosthecobacter sp.]|uniref:gamma-glutamylcyclotransferase family protein n=1 Tax=Prosthecobacter sp. TaxID=1965333 RepID=UPI0025F7BCD9|nr:gamma-glutamylcyclotransferase family protein [Prosthecobacter sp.]MCF7785726.1 gamma-glutamylcyclotransferase [Prosthecobacter sp.]
MKTLVFVYGTLKRGGENHGWIGQQQFVAEAQTAPLYRMVDLGGYPGMVRSADGISIQGEVWSVDEAGLTKLDVLEDTEGGEYERVPVQLEGDFATQRVEGYIYLHSIEGRRDVGACW